MPSDLFEKAREVIFRMVESDVYFRFVTTQEYQWMVRRNLQYLVVESHSPLSVCRSKAGFLNKAVRLRWVVRRAPALPANPLPRPCLHLLLHQHRNPRLAKSCSARV